MTYSFIIPHHNSPELLNRCLDTIPQREDIQIIVVDDNSKAELRPTITRSDVEVIYIDAEHTKGAGHARNVGIERARGKWLLFADCDDYYSDGFIDVLDKYKDFDIDVLYFNVCFKDPDSLSPQKKFIITSYFEQYDGSEGTLENIKYRVNSPWTKMLNAKYVLSNSILFEEVPNGNDVLFSLLVAVNAKNVMVEKQQLYTYVYNKNGITNRVKSNEEIVCEIVHSIKLNTFYKSIRHSEWQSFLFKYLLLSIYGSKTPFKLLWRLLIAISDMIYKKDYWSINKLYRC